MRTGPSHFGLFCRSMVLTLALLLPMVAAVAFLADQRQQQLALVRVTAEQSDVPIEAGAQNIHRLLLAVQGEQPEFLLLRADAPAAAITLCAVPGAALVQAPTGQTTLADCYLVAGPARAAALLEATVGIGPEHYFAATPATYAALLPEEQMAELDTRPLLPPAVREQLGVGEDGLLSLTPLTAEDALRTARAGSDGLPALRAMVWAALLRSAPEALPQCVEAAKDATARTLTDLAAQDWRALAQTMRYLAAREDLRVDYDSLPTRPAAGGECLTPEALARAAALLG